MYPIFFKLKGPLIVDFELTYDCNLNCEFCYVKKRMTRNIDINRRLVLLNEMIDLGVNHVVFTGGEPLLNGQLFDLLSHLKNNGVNASVNTNATLITNETAELLKSLNVPVLVSLYGSTPLDHDCQTRVAGSWEKTLTGIKHLKEENVRFGINMTMTKKNFRLIECVAQIASSLGAEFTFSRFISSSRKQYEELGLSNSELKELNNIIKISKLDVLRDSISLSPIPICSEGDVRSGICRAALTRCCITPDLYVKPCPFFDCLIGYLDNNPLKEIWLSDDMEYWRSGAYSKECLSCDIFAICGGGCKVVASYFHKDPLINLKYNSKFKPDINWITKNVEIDESARYEPSAYVRLREERFGGVLISQNGKEAILDNPTSLYIWRLIERTATVNDIIQNVVTEFSVERDIANTDVKRFVSHLIAQNWVRKIG